MHCSKERLLQIINAWLLLTVFTEYNSAVDSLTSCVKRNNGIILSFNGEVIIIHESTFTK